MLFLGAGVGLLGIGTFTQVNGITSAVGDFFDSQKACTVALFGREYTVAVLIAGLILTICVALVVLGGLMRIATFPRIIVPVYGCLLCGCQHYGFMCKMHKGFLWHLR